MMSIGSITTPPTSGTSPRDQIVSTLEAQVEAGEITSDDSDAMLAALDTMHEERMAAGEPDLSSGPPSEDEMQANFESMLSEQVEAGTLTEDQADELSALFESGELAPPPPPPPPVNASAGTQTTDTSSDEDTTTDTSSSTSSELSTEDLMSALLEQISNSFGYDNSGSTASSSTDSVFADFLA